MADEMSKVRVGSSESEYSASERLRAMLDERGIEYTTNDFGYCRDTIWDGGAAVQLTRHAGLMMVVTPEQAIAATVGAGTCKMHKVIDSGITSLRCSECGHETFYEYQFNNGNEFFAYPYPNYCPNCGRRVVE